MSQQKVASSKDPTPTGPAPECKVPVDPTPPMPDKLLLSDDSVSVPPGDGTGPMEEPRHYQEVVAKLKSDMDLYFSVPGYGYLGPSIARRFLGLLLIKSGMDLNAVQQERPANANLVPGAGRSILKATSSPEGAVMQVNRAALTGELEQLDYRKELFGALDWAPQVVRVNLSHNEAAVAGTVRLGLGRVQSMLDTNFALRSALTDALNWRDLSSQKAQETRRDRDKVAKKVRSDVEAEKQAEAGKAGPDKPAPLPPADPPPIVNARVSRTGSR